MLRSSSFLRPAPLRRVLGHRAGHLYAVQCMGVASSARGSGKRSTRPLKMTVWQPPKQTKSPTRHLHPVPTIKLVDVDAVIKIPDSFVGEERLLVEQSLRKLWLMKDISAVPVILRDFHQLATAVQSPSELGALCLPLVQQIAHRIKSPEAGPWIGLLGELSRHGHGQQQGTAVSEAYRRHVFLMLDNLYSSWAADPQAIARIMTGAENCGIPASTVLLTYLQRHNTPAGLTHTLHALFHVRAAAEQGDAMGSWAQLSPQVQGMLWEIINRQAASMLGSSIYNLFMILGRLQCRPTGQEEVKVCHYLMMKGLTLGDSIKDKGRTFISKQNANIMLGMGRMGFTVQNLPPAITQWIRGVIEHTLPMNQPLSMGPLYMGLGDMGWSYADMEVRVQLLLQDTMVRTLPGMDIWGLWSMLHGLQNMGCGWADLQAETEGALTLGIERILEVFAKQRAVAVSGPTANILLMSHVCHLFVALHRMSAPPAVLKDVKAAFMCPSSDAKDLSQCLGILIERCVELPKEDKQLEQLHRELAKGFQQLMKERKPLTAPQHRMYATYQQFLALRPSVETSAPALPAALPAGCRLLGPQGWEVIGVHDSSNRLLGLLTMGAGQQVKEHLCNMRYPGSPVHSLGDAVVTEEELRTVIKGICKQTDMLQGENKGSLEGSSHC